MSTPDEYQRPPLRYRRYGGGYRRDDVDFALAELRLTMRQLDNDLESLRDRNRELEAELAAAQTELESLRERGDELPKTMAASLRRAAEIEEAASGRAQEIIAKAEAAGMEIRSEGIRRMEEATAQFNELLRLKDSLLDALRSVVGDFDQAISRVERGEPLFPGATATIPSEAPSTSAAAPEEPAAAPAEEAEPAPPFVAQPPSAPAGETELPPDTASFPATATVPVEAQPVASPSREEEEPVFEARVELDAGPFSDFAELSAFERALAQVGKVEDVYVRRLADDRALIELTLSEPATLLKSMREALPYSVEVRSVNRSKIVADVFAQSPAGTR